MQNIQANLHAVFTNIGIYLSYNIFKPLLPTCKIRVVKQKQKLVGKAAHCLTNNSIIYVVSEEYQKFNTLDSFALRVKTISRKLKFPNRGQLQQIPALKLLYISRRAL